MKKTASALLVLVCCQFVGLSTLSASNTQQSATASVCGAIPQQRILQSGIEQKHDRNSSREETTSRVLPRSDCGWYKGMGWR